MGGELIFQATRKDFRIDWFSGTGAGGQYRNKHQNCCRIVHIPSGLMAVGQRERSRERNFADAFRRLARKVVSNAIGDMTRPRGVEGDVVRTYHEADNYVKDHASDHRQAMDHLDMDELIVARKLALW